MSEQKLAPLKTAEDMYNYCEQQNMGTGFSKSWSIKHFSLIENELRAGESILTAYVGRLSKNSDGNSGYNYAFALTPKRFIMAQKRIIGNFLKSIYLENVNDVTMKKGLIFGTIEVDTIKEVVQIEVAKECADNIYYCITSSLERIKKANKEREDSVGTLKGSDAEEILKFKQLLDSGIITEEEFNYKKKQILGI